MSSGGSPASGGRCSVRNDVDAVRGASPHQRHQWSSNASAAAIGQKIAPVMTCVTGYSSTVADTTRPNPPPPPRTASKSSGS